MNQQQRRVFFIWWEWHLGCQQHVSMVMTQATSCCPGMSAEIYHLLWINLMKHGGGEEGGWGVVFFTPWVSNKTEKIWARSRSYSRYPQYSCTHRCSHTLWIIKACRWKPFCSIHLFFTPNKQDSHSATGFFLSSTNQTLGSADLNDSTVCLQGVVHEAVIISNQRFSTVNVKIMVVMKTALPLTSRRCVALTASATVSWRYYSDPENYHVREECFKVK